MNAQGDVNSFRPMVVGICTNEYYGFYTLLNTTGFNTFQLSFNCTDQSCSVCNTTVTMAIDVCANDPLNANYSFFLSPNPCFLANTNMSTIPSNAVSLGIANDTNVCFNSNHYDLITFVGVSANPICVPFTNGTFAYLAVNSNGYFGGVYCTAGCVSCQQTFANIALGACQAGSVANTSVFVTATSNLHTCFAPPTNVYLSHVFDPSCSMSTPGNTNSFRPLPVGQCSNAFFGSYSFVSSTGPGTYALNFNCTDATCSVCSTALTLATGVCAPDPMNSSYSFLLSNNHCFDAQTNPSAVAAGSISLIWSNDTNTCYNSSHFEVLTAGIVTSAGTCLSYAYGTFALIQLNPDSTYSGGVFCNAGCTLCNESFMSVPINTCVAGTIYNTSFAVTNTSSLSTCYSIPATMYLSHLNSPTCTTTTGVQNSYRPIPVGVCSNVTFGTYSLLTSQDYNIYALLYNCDDATCSQCAGDLLLSQDVCAPDPYNSSYGFLLTNNRCFLAQTNPATISSTSVSLIVANDTPSCFNSTHFDVLTFGTPLPLQINCLQFSYGLYSSLYYATNGSYSAGYGCAAGCTGCQQYFYGVLPNTCNTQSATSSVAVATTTNLYTCYTPPVTMYLSWTSDPTCSMSTAGNVNNYNAYVIGQCTNYAPGQYALLTSTGLNTFALLWGCSNSGCSQCGGALTLAENVCAPDAYNNSLSFLLTSNRCFLAQTNPATITASAISIVYSQDTTSCFQSNNFNVINYGAVPVGSSCVQFIGNTYAQLSSTGNGLYSGSILCNSGCTACNQTFTNIPLNSCVPGINPNTSFWLSNTSNLHSCYVMPTSLYLSHLQDP